MWNHCIYKYLICGEIRSGEEFREVSSGEIAKSLDLKVEFSVPSARMIHLNDSLFMVPGGLSGFSPGFFDIIVFFCFPSTEGNPNCKK